jgi:hypothetical protein
MLSVGFFKRDNYNGETRRTAKKPPDGGSV